MGCCGDVLQSDSFGKIHLFFHLASVHESQDKEMKQQGMHHHHPCRSVANCRIPPCGGCSQWYTLQLTTPVNRTGTWGWFNRGLPVQHAMPFLSRGSKHWWERLDSTGRQKSIPFMKEENLGLACLWNFPVFMKTSLLSVCRITYLAVMSCLVSHHSPTSSF